MLLSFCTYAVPSPASSAQSSDITFHCLRDTYISRLAPYCAVPTLMVLARHRSLNTTRRYLHIEERHLRQAVERLNPQPEEPTVTRIVEGLHESL